MCTHQGFLAGQVGRSTGKTTVRPHSPSLPPLPPWFLYVFFWLANVQFLRERREEGVIWMLHVGWARHPGLVVGNDPVDLLTVEFVHIGGWIPQGDLALYSSAQFFAVLSTGESRLESGRLGIRCVRQVFNLFGCLPVRTRSRVDVLGWVWSVCVVRL